MAVDYAEVDYDEIVQETDKAVKIRIGKSLHWIPRFAIKDWNEQEKQMHVREDIAVEKGLA